MIELYKLVFDLSVYFTLSGYYLFLTSKTPPSVAGFLALAAAAALDALLRGKLAPHASRRIWRFLPLLLPALAFFFHPTLWQIVQLLPAWLYVGWVMLTDRIEILYDEFKSHFGFGLRLLLLMVFGPLFPSQLSAALLQSIPYLVLMLASGVCLLRMLRERKPSGLRQGIYIGLFVVLCAGLTVGKAPQLLLKCAGIVYRSVIAPLLFVAAIALAGLFYVFYLLSAWIVARARGSQEPLKIDLQNAAEMLGLEDQYAAYTVNLEWLKILLIVLGAAALALFVFLLFRRLIGERAGKAAQPVWTEHRRNVPGRSPAAVKPGLIRPRDPRLAVRYYYARFLVECRKRGLSIPSGMTATELSAHCCAVFRGVDPAEIAQVYLPVRYSDKRPVTQADVQRASELWRALKKSVSGAETAHQKNVKSP